QVLEELSYRDSSSQDISLSIDIALQSYLSEIFADNSGAAVIMDAYNGEILAASSFPEYDLNPFVRGISTKDWKALIENLDHPFTNRLVNANYPPGSVVKMGVGLAFLNSNSINTATEFYCSGSVELAGRNFRCWNRSGHGSMDLKHAIKHSCDVYFYEGGLKVGIDLIASTLSRIGFGAKTGV
ncbi:penicillin-binding protein 2, partial [Campylobacter upsaliensis]|nr:penicillin-binding protein 2 [Campylobacter upsaliensis]